MLQHPLRNKLRSQQSGIYITETEQLPLTEPLSDHLRKEVKDQSFIFSCMSPTLM